MIGILLLALGAGFIAGSLFVMFFDEIVEWADHLVDRIDNAVRAILVFAIKAGHRVFSKLYTRYVSGKITVVNSEKDIDIDDVKDEKIRRKLMKKKEVDIKEYA
jgi:hypothetical protein